jgi:flagellar assembly protein FliH
VPLIKSANFPTQTSAFSMKDIENHAKTLILRARQQADQLLTEAQKQAEQFKRQAAEQGHREGYARGLQEGTAAGKKSGHDQALTENRTQLTQLIQSLSRTLEQIEQQRHEMETEATLDVVALATAIARRVIKRQVDIDPAVLTANLTEAMKLVVHAADLRVAVHPSQKQTLLNELPNLKMQWPSLEHVELIEDASLSPGGCRVQSRQGVINADLEEQLDRVMANLLPGKEKP